MDQLARRKDGVVGSHWWLKYFIELENDRGGVLRSTGVARLAKPFRPGACRSPEESGGLIVDSWCLWSFLTFAPGMGKWAEKLWVGAADGYYGVSVIIEEIEVKGTLLPHPLKCTIGSFFLILLLHSPASPLPTVPCTTLRPPSTNNTEPCRLESRHDSTA